MGGDNPAVVHKTRRGVEYQHSSYDQLQPCIEKDHTAPGYARISFR